MKGRKTKKLLFWNVSGIGRQEVEFWKYVSQWDFICFSETWLEEKGWRKLKGRLPKTHIWECCFAHRLKKKRKGKRRIFNRKRKKMGNRRGRFNKSSRREGVVVTRIGKSEEKRSLIIVSICNTEEWKKMENAIQKVREENKENYVNIGGDFNARIKVNGNNEEGWDIKRNSKDKIENSRGKALINMVERMGGYILNGTTKGDKEGEYTYVGTRGCSVIDCYCK